MWSSFSVCLDHTGILEGKSEVIHGRRINDRLHLYLSFQWAELRGPEPRHERDEDIRRISPHYHFKCSRARQTREIERIKGERGREETRESGLSCAEARIETLNEHEICTVSAGHRKQCRIVHVYLITISVRAWGDSASCMCRSVHKEEACACTYRLPTGVSLRMCVCSQHVGCVCVQEVSLNLHEQVCVAVWQQQVWESHRTVQHMEKNTSGCLC